MTIVDAYPDLERAMVDHLTTWLPELGEGFADTTVGVGLPEWWRPAQGPHLSVREDGSSEVRAWSEYAPLLETATVRVVAWSDSPTRVKHLARLAREVALRFPAKPALGVRAALDEDSRAHIASFTVTVRRRPVRP